MSAGVTVADRITEKLADGIALDHLEVVNESSNHNVPAGSESHFKVVLVADAFSDLRLIARHQLVNRLLREELNGVIHALAIHTYSPAEWQERFADVPLSPPCLGGSAQG